MDERDVWNLQSTVADQERDVENLQLIVNEQERQIRDLQQRVVTLETGQTRINRRLEEYLEEKIGRIWKAIRRLEGKEIER